MREIFTFGSVGGAPGNRCFYPEYVLDHQMIKLLDLLGAPCRGDSEQTLRRSHIPGDQGKGDLDKNHCKRLRNTIFSSSS